MGYKYSYNWFISTMNLQVGFTVGFGASEHPFLEAAAKRQQQELQQLRSRWEWQASCD